MWIPANRPRDWRPYTDGHWGYTEEWGWYWISADDEQDWGWVAFHYGRWVFDPQLGWIWIPRTEWSPGWVDWRRGARGGVHHVGWAPLPPDDIVVEVERTPAVWVFVRDRDFIAPRIRDVVIEQREYDVLFRETVVVNRTIIVDERQHIAVNPGIEPTFIAAAVGRPLHPIEVRPAVLAGTVRLSNAIEVRANERRNVRETVVERREAAIEPAPNIPPPTPLRPGEKGRLGDHPPALARQAPPGGQPGAAPGTAGRERLPGAPAETRREQPGTPSTAQQPQRPGAPSTAQQPQRPGAPSTAQQPQRPGAPSTAQQPRRPGEPTTEQQPQRPGTPSAAEQRKQPGAPEERQRRGAERQPGVGPEQRRGEMPKPTGREAGRAPPGAPQAATQPTRPEQRGQGAKPQQGREGSRALQQRESPPGAAAAREEQRGRMEQRPGASAQQPQRGRIEERRGPSAAEQQRARPEQRPGPSTAEQRGGRGATVHEQRPPSPQQGRAQERAPGGRGGAGMAQQPRGGGEKPAGGSQPKGPRGPGANPAEPR